MKLFRKRIKGNNKGLSLVELVCAVAIFGVAATAIGSAMVVSAQSYSRGTYELDVQEEAQTATNIVGNLIFDAVEASQSGNEVTIKGEGITYTITYDSASQTLKYAESTGGPEPARGVLAENVTSFSTSLTPNPNDFKLDRNVTVDISIEKNGRTYEASYNTTARNGSADAVGAVESATIMVDPVVIIEPGQTNLEIPCTVYGSVVNKTFSITGLGGTGPLTANPGTNCVRLTATNDAEYSYSFIVETNEKKEDGITPLDSKTVVVQVRHIAGMSGTKTVTSGNEGAIGSTYKVNFTYTGNATAYDKVYGRDYDTNYVDPRQFSFSYVDASGNNIESEYIESKVEQTGAYPSVTFKLKKEMPMGTKIFVKCTAKHTNGTNKTGTVYGPISASVPINKSPFTGGGEITRGMDGDVKISVDATYMQNLRNTNTGCTINKIMEVYEASVDASGNFTKTSATPVFSYNSVDSGNDTHIRALDSKRMIPNQAYIIVVRLEAVDASGNVKWPTDDVDPTEYVREYPLSPIDVTYNAYGGHAGTSGDPYKFNAGSMYDNVTFKAIGLDMSKGWRNALAWKVQKFDGTNWVDTSATEIGLMNGTSNGNGTMKVKFSTTGHYRLMTWMDNITYRNYTDTADVTGDFIFYNTTTGAGIVYIDVE